MQEEKVQKKLKATIKCEMFDVVDLTVDFSWMIAEMENEEKTYDIAGEVGPKVELPKVLSFCEMMERLSPH